MDTNMDTNSPHREMPGLDAPPAGDTASIALVQKQFDELRQLIVEFIEDDAAKKEIAENVAATLRLVQLRENDMVRLEERLDRVEADLQEVLRMKKVVAFSSTSSDKTQ